MVNTKNSKWTTFLGPVENLESYVKADWWRHLFNADRSHYLITRARTVNKREGKNVTFKEGASG
jgi:hypothetical protein